MRLKSISMKGFKSFPDRTALEFAPGVSVVVGPNGSGKSNVTDAVLWAMGEQSPLAVRGQSMQDVIFAGGHGRQAARSAEVELVFDNADGGLPVPSAEVSVLRRLDRNGEGEYRLNGARCRMSDILEILSDSGLGKEGHSVVGQGRVEAIVTSKPRDRRLLIEEAAGLGKHRRRRRRAQLKLDRTRENLDRALDIEREARAHLRPLKRQAEAAEIHARLERQTLEARWSLGRDDLRQRAADLLGAETAAATARKERDRLGIESARIAKERSEAEDALAGRAKERDDLSRRTWAVRNAVEKIDDRVASLRSSLAAVEDRIQTDTAELGQAEALASSGNEDPQAARRGELGRRLAELDAELSRERAGEMQGLEESSAQAAARVLAATEELSRLKGDASVAETKLADARTHVTQARKAHEDAKFAAVRADAELATVDEFLRSNGGGISGGRSLADGLKVEQGLEAAVAAALGGRLSANVVEDMAEGVSVLNSTGDNGGLAIIAGATGSGPQEAKPCIGARALTDVVQGDGREADLARILLANCWLVEDFESVDINFMGIVVTRAGRAWSASTGELRQAPGGGAGRLLQERNRRESLVEAAEQARSLVVAAQGSLTEQEAGFKAVELGREQALAARRSSQQAMDEANEAARRAAWQIKTRSESPQAGPVAVERAEVAAELAAEERIAARMADERDGARTRMAALAERMRLDRDRTPSISALVASLESARQIIEPLRVALDLELAGDSEQGDGVASRLRQLAAAEAEVQASMAKTAESVTVSEVESQRLRDRSEESKAEVRELSSALGLEDGPATEALAADARDGLTNLIERLEKRRVQLGPVNPLAADEYKAALEHLEELEAQRTDLEEALKELKGLVRDCDRTIRETFEETFEAASKHFEELSAQLFPGGGGRLRLVTEVPATQAVLGGEGEASAEVESADADEFDELTGDEPQFGVEIEITPAGKTMKRLSLLSGGEKSMTAIAFLFAVFLAKPCPFYILDEVEAALDDLNLGRFLDLLRTYRDRAQFIVVTHQRRTMEAADALYGVTMAGDGVSKVVSRRLGPEELEEAAA
ncbi:MAG: AAA family ATPase [Solirubrobacterales bacterium]|nr:AAA family ATPase [Solirubrobacterales bacterium]